MTSLRISGKVLGQLALDDFCERCFWVKLKCQQHLPFQFFPGIFSSIDSYSKRITNSHYEKDGRLPKWFDALGELGQPIAVPHHSKFNFMDSTTGILLTGAPDEMFRRRDASLFIADYKTARLTEHQDALQGLYAVQLNSYGYVAEKIGMGKVTGLGLIYYEPETALTVADVDAVIQDSGFSMRFIAKVLPVELNPNSIPPLLARVRKIYDLPYASAGRPGCRDCRLLDGLVELLTSPLPSDEREKLKGKLSELREWLEFGYFEKGILSEEVRAHRVGLSAARRTNAKRDAEQKRLRLEIAAVERQLQGN
jgi:hypothetical protein